MSELVRNPSGLLVPREYAELRELPETACPAAEAHHFKNTGRPAIRCKVARNSFPLDEGANAAAMWCCNEAGYTECPVWQSARNDDPDLKRSHQALQDRLTREENERQIRAGVRVDDAGLELDDLHKEHLARQRDPEREEYEG